MVQQQNSPQDKNSPDALPQEKEDKYIKKQNANKDKERVQNLSQNRR